MEDTNVQIAALTAQLAALTERVAKLEATPAKPARAVAKKVDATTVFKFTKAPTEGAHSKVYFAKLGLNKEFKLADVAAIVKGGAFKVTRPPEAVAEDDMRWAAGKGFVEIVVKAEAPAPKPTATPAAPKAATPAAPKAAPKAATPAKADDKKPAQA
ncbi:MAG: hypothetical protein Q8P18_18420 [Pseudomonadota bacterium]|nr:hypothetical protein [Pseudomonadota bacterium]